LTYLKLKIKKNIPKESASSSLILLDSRVWKWLPFFDEARLVLFSWQPRLPSLLLPTQKNKNKFVSKCETYGISKQTYPKWSRLPCSFSSFPAIEIDEVSLIKQDCFCSLRVHLIHLHRSLLGKIINRYTILRAKQFLKNTVPIELCFFFSFVNRNDWRRRGLFFGSHEGLLFFSLRSRCSSCSFPICK